MRGRMRRFSRAAADALGKIGDVRAVEALCRALAGNGREAASVARALGELHDRRAIEPLRDYLLARESHDDGCREAAAALSRIRHPEAVVALVKVNLESPNPHAMLPARRALGELTGRSFAFEPKETVANWWKENRQHYLGLEKERE